MATKKFITKNGLQTQNIDFVSLDETKTLAISLSNDSTLSVEGTNGQLFSISDNMSGTIFSVNDISGIPSLEILDTGLVKIAQYSGNVVLGSATDNGNKLQVNGNVSALAFISSVATGTAPLTITSTTLVANLNADLLDGQHGSYYAVDSNVVKLSGDQSISGLKTFANPELRIGSSDTSNHISFRGTSGDGAGTFNHTYIGEYLYGGTESSELLLFKGNDFGTSGPDRIRSIAANHVFQTYTTAFSGTFATVAASTTPLTRMVILQDGKVGINTSSPAYQLEVNGSFAATSKSFLINHPTKPGKKLLHGSLEGPEHGVYVRGQIKGKVIELPEYWTKLVDPESITVQLTAIGKGQKLYVEDIKDNKVIIANDGIFISEPYCYYFIQAERADIEKLKAEN